MSLVNASRSELTKQFTTAIWWILGLVLLVYVGSTAGGLAATFGALDSGALGGDAVNGPALPAEMLQPVIYSLATAVGYVFPLLIGTLLVTNEFRHKTQRFAPGCGHKISSSRSTGRGTSRKCTAWPKPSTASTKTCCC